jgi:hypothetical protein
VKTPAAACGGSVFIGGGVGVFLVIGLLGAFWLYFNA